MNEISIFVDKLNACDSITLTVGTDHTYCQFSLGGLYQDRVYVTDEVLVAQLREFSNEQGIVDITGIAKLKQMLLVT